MEIDRTEQIRMAHAFGMIQNEIEVRMFLDFYDTIPSKRIMEVGTHTGGFLYLLSAFGRDKEKKLIISVDLPWRDHEYAAGNFRETYKGNVNFIVGNSHDTATRESIAAIAGGPDTLDFIFYDADHSYQGTQKDFCFCLDLIKPGGWLGLHDINNGHECGKFYWTEAIKDRKHIEFGFGRTFGIGCIQK